MRPEVSTTPHAMCPTSGTPQRRFLEAELIFVDLFSNKFYLKLYAEAEQGLGIAE